MSDEIDDGATKPLGYQTENGELEVRVDETTGQKCYHETELGQWQRWMRQAPDLYEKYQALVEQLSLLDAAAALAAPDAAQLQTPLAASGARPFMDAAGLCEARGWHASAETIRAIARAYVDPSVLG